MAARNVGDEPSAAAQHPGRVWRHRFVLRAALSVAAMLTLLVGIELGIRLLSPDAVQVSAASVADGHTLATREITDLRTVSDLFTGIDSLPGAGLSADHNCMEPRSDAVTISFRFTRWGLPVEVATLPGDSCGSWLVSRGGISDSRNDPSGQTRAILSEAQLSVPLP